MSQETHHGESVVVPAVSPPHSLACLRSLGRRGIHTIAVCEQPATPAFGSRYCDEKFVVPSPTDNLTKYKDALLSLASRDDVRTIIPMREEDVYVLSKYRSEFAEYLTPLWPPFETVRTVHDGARLAATAKTVGVPVPATQLLDEVEQWDRKRIVKARYALLTDDYVASGRPERYRSPNPVHYLEPGVEPDQAAIQAEMDHTPIVQEYVPGDEYAVWALYDHGEPVVTCQKHQLRARSYAGGTSIYRETAYDPELEEMGRTLLNHLDWHGFASVQFKQDATTGEFILLEINPRAWVSLSCPIQAGVDFPYYYWQVAGGEDIHGETNCKLGVGTHDLAGEMMYLRSILREDNPFVEPPSLSTALWDVASSLCTQPHYEHLVHDDPRPFARIIRNRLEI